MNQTEILITALRVAYPSLQPQVVNKNETAYVDDAKVAEDLVSVVVNDFLIHDPFISECGRFPVDPEIEYGVSFEMALRIADHNGMT